jgi:hypothetical protein
MATQGGWHGEKHRGLAWGRHALERVSCFGDGDFREGMLKFSRMEAKVLIKLRTWNREFSAHVQNKRKQAYSKHGSRKGVRYI